MEQLIHNGKKGYISAVRAKGTHYWNNTNRTSSKLMLQEEQFDAVRPNYLYKAGEISHENENLPAHNPMDILGGEIHSEKNKLTKVIRSVHPSIIFCLVFV